MSTTEIEYFAAIGCRFGMRANVREPHDPYLYIFMLAHAEDGETVTGTLRLSPLGAMDLVERISREMGLRFHRQDIFESLMRTEPRQGEFDVRPDL